MSYLAERRKYQRCGCIVSKVLLSTNEIRWETIEMANLSAGGILFKSSHLFPENMKLHFNLYVYNMLSEFNIRLEGRVVRMERSAGQTAFAVRFENINKHQQVQLDELVKCKMTVRSCQEHTLTHEEYSLLLLPRLRPRNNRITIRPWR